MESAVIIAGGFASGDWLLGLLFGLVAVAATVQWLVMRTQASDEARVAVDGGVLGMLAVLLWLAVLASRHLEAWWSAP